MPTLSVFIIALNEERNIGRCLESVRWADEIVVVDSGSTDQTKQICSKFTDKVHVRPFLDYADQKNHALALTTGDWALSIDADEEVTPELKEEILSVMQGAQKKNAYRIPRRSRIFGRWMRYTGTQKDNPVRLFRRGAVVFEQPIHETVMVTGGVGCLKNVLLHYTYDTLSDYLCRLNRYTTMETEFFKGASRPLNQTDLTLKPFLIFAKLYFVEQGFRDKVQGFYFSLLSAYYAFVKHAKYREMMQAR